MKPSVPLLAPLLRSDTQGRLLAELYLHPERERSVTELASAADTAVANASRELGRMVDAGFLLARTVGRSRLLRVNEEHPLYRPVAEILRYAYGPIAVLAPLLRGVPGIDEAYVYGSWAARLVGEAGPDPRDVDVLIVGDAVDLAALDGVAETARKQLGREVHPRVVSRRAWGEKTDLFLRHLYDRPLVSILPVY
ncbi:helix-turn-helix domain-containing protein [Agrococcus sp. TSP3-2-1]|uniref:helix-turn-helix domain-containing protein n=1 Tax=Agrococcus sp. TSP3-2-1 TaxID=2804583 RepID=UPI003CFB5B4C